MWFRTHGTIIKIEYICPSNHLITIFAFDPLQYVKLCTSSHMQPACASIHCVCYLPAGGSATGLYWRRKLPAYYSCNNSSAVTHLLSHTHKHTHISGHYQRKQWSTVNMAMLYTKVLGKHSTYVQRVSGKAHTHARIMQNNVQTFHLSLLLPYSLLCLIPSPHIRISPPPPSPECSITIRARVEHILIGPMHCHQNGNQRPAVTHPCIRIMYSMAAILY